MGWCAVGRGCVKACEGLKAGLGIQTEGFRRKRYNDTEAEYEWYEKNAIVGIRLTNAIPVTAIITILNDTK